MTAIRILVTGSRVWPAPERVRAALVVAAADHEQVTVVHGRCDPRRPDGGRVTWAAGLRAPDPFVLHGADWYADRIAAEFGWAVEAWPANWAHDGKAAGPIRSQAMVDTGADTCLAFPIGASGGTWDCIRRARAAGIPTTVVTG